MVSPVPFLHGDREVIAVLRERRAARTTPGARDDDHRVALVIGGGGMRGAYVAGMLRALDRAGLVPAFDEVYGASSGGFSGAAFLTGEAAACAASYPEDLCTDVFINMRRLGSRRPVVALDHLVHDVLSDRKPLAWHELGRTPAPLRVVATDAADLTAHTLVGMETVEDWKRALRASASIPLLAGPPISWGGRRWVDGSVAEPLAMARALRGGATHVLVLLCRGTDDLHPDADAGLSLWARALDRLVPGLGSLAQGSRRYGVDLRLVTDAAHPDRGPGHLAAIGPARSAGMGALCVDPVRVGDAVRIGDESAVAALDAVAA
ncbi:patatin-like phospholipase family protein [Pseudonocardia cypriaca]|uniref:Putative patatin/cPLA2 family phospholipase n=1 Tax=Pseudonocardia cypriaca TaxID=882449 RepID=A0A543FWT2_9PSEU|nr:patatin-like phospholipase family protein [Pseudonocardia cypriaca]TQM38300.1 putative patatin/cPLA2 family phospholipase [Pseudonocardia cypriaca]